MATPFLIGASAGLVSAALFGSAATATALAGILFYLAPLPICLAGLGWGATAAAIAALAGTVVVGSVLGLATGAIFTGAVAMPMALLCYLALLSRPAVGPQGKASEALEWYPIGRLVGWAAVIGGVLAAIMVLMLGYDTDSYRDSIKHLLQHNALKELDRDGTLINETTIGSLSSLLARTLPAAFAIVWQTVALFNLWLAGVIVEASGRALRPWPQIDAIELPNAVFLALTGSLLASFLPGLAGLLATGLAGALLFAYVLQGLAVLHAFTRGMAFRGLLLTAIYIGILLLAWVAIAIAILGLSEPMLRLRERAAARGQPPTQD
jgi:magnesium-transporting ATPase (P-type)